MFRASIRYILSRNSPKIVQDHSIPRVYIKIDNHVANPSVDSLKELQWKKIKINLEDEMGNILKIDDAKLILYEKDTVQNYTLQNRATRGDIQKLEEKISKKIDEQNNSWVGPALCAMTIFTMVVRFYN